MGDKIAAKATVSAARRARRPGHRPARPDRRRPDRRGRGDVGFPVLLKPSAGGGGKGMRLVHERAELPAAIAARAPRSAARRSATTRCSSSASYRTPATSRSRCSPTRYGNVVHLGERECSLQRRHQKIIEEAPSPLLDAATRARRWARRRSTPPRSVRLHRRRHGRVHRVRRPARRVLLHGDEHPPAGRASGHGDGHRRRPRRAAGAHRRRRAAAVRTRTTSRSTGHAIEARVYAEDPARGFLPTGGQVLALVEPARPWRARRLRHRRRHGGRQRLRPDARQGDRARRRPSRRPCARSTARWRTPPCSG